MAGLDHVCKLGAITTLRSQSVSPILVGAGEFLTTKVSRDRTQEHNRMT